MEPAARTTAVLKKDSPVFVRPGALAPLHTILAGTRVTVKEEVDDWLMIEFRDAKWGVRVGYVLRENSNGDPYSRLCKAALQDNCTREQE